MQKKASPENTAYFSVSCKKKQVRREQCIIQFHAKKASAEKTAYTPVSCKKEASAENTAY
jgi:hypothetical protein